MDGPIRRPRQKLPFTIDNILSRFPNGNGGQRSAGAGESAAGPLAVLRCACLCCCGCCCSHCGDLLQADFSHEGELKYGWTAAKLAGPRRPGDPRQNPGRVQRRTRRHRTIFTEEQLDALEELFLQNQYPDVNTREKLAQQTHLREERVEVMTHYSRLLDKKPFFLHFIHRFDMDALLQCLHVRVCRQALKRPTVVLLTGLVQKPQSKVEAPEKIIFCSGNGRRCVLCRACL
uniref:Goosecoid homeobox 2 n=1 Tax=Tetraodon nigroviridis TaxID=99883 RepID=H3CUK3_TETNG